jgi:hypothetical protein
MIIYAACKNVSPLAYRELMDMVSAVKDRGLVDGIDNISKTKIRSIFALLKNAQAILANNEINNSVRLYLGKGVINFHDFRVKHDQFLQRCILKQAPFHPLMNSDEVLWPVNQSSVLEEKIKECERYLMSLEEFFQGGQFQSMRQATPPENMSASDAMKDPLNFPNVTQKNPGSDFFLSTTGTNASTAASSLGPGGGAGVPLYETKRVNTSGMNPRNTFEDNSRSYDNNYSAAGGYTSREFVPGGNINTRQVPTYDSQSFTNQPHQGGGGGGGPSTHYSGSVDPSASSYSLSAVSSTQYYNTYGNTNVGGGGGGNNRLYGNNNNNNSNMGNMNNNRNRFQQQQQQPYQQHQQRQYHHQQQPQQQQQQQRQYYHSSQSQSMLSQPPQNAGGGYQRNSGSANTLARSNSLGDSYYSSDLPQQQQLRGGESDFYSNYHPSQSKVLSDEQLGGLSVYSQFQNKDFPSSNQQLPQQQKLPLSAANPLLDSPIFTSSSAVNINNNNNNNTNNKDYFSFEQSDFDTFN